VEIGGYQKKNDVGRESTFKTRYCLEELKINPKTEKVAEDCEHILTASRAKVVS